MAKSRVSIQLFSVLIAFFFSFGAIQAWESNDEDLEKEVDLLVNSYEKPVLVEISNKLIKIASHEDDEGDFYNSVKHFREAILIRNRIGLPKNDIAYANLLYLTSISEMHLEAFCDAKTHAEEAFTIYLQAKDKKFSHSLEKEIQTMSTSCLIAISEE